jgi:hypothetical protein
MAWIPSHDVSFNPYTGVLHFSVNDRGWTITPEGAQVLRSEIERLGMTLARTAATDDTVCCAKYVLGSVLQSLVARRELRPEITRYSGS